MGTQNKYKKLALNSILFLIGSIGSKFITFFLVPLYTNTLSTAEYGITDIVTTTVTLCIPIFSLSLDDAIMRYGLIKGINKQNLARNMLVILSGTTIAIAMFYPVFNVLNILGEWTVFFCLILLLRITRNAFSIYLKSVDRIKVFTVDSIIYAFALGALNVLFLKVFKFGVRGYFIALLLSMLISLTFQTLVGHIGVDIYQGKYDGQLLRNMLKYSTPLILSAISWWIIHSSDRYMLTYFMDYDAVGLYAVAAKIPNFINTFTSVFTSAWLISSITEYENNKDKSFYSKVFGLYVTFLSMSCSAILLFLKPFMSIYVGANFFAAWKYAPLLLVGAVCGTLVSFFTPIYKAEFMNKKEVLLVMIGAISNIAINAVCIPYLGIQGACIGTICAEIVMLVYCIKGTRSFFKFDIDFSSFVLSITILIIQAISIILLSNISFVISSISIIALLYIHFGNIKAIIEVIMKKKRGRYSYE